MKKTIQDTTGLKEVDSELNPEYFTPEELKITVREKNIDAMIAKSKSLGWI